MNWRSRLQKTPKRVRRWLYIAGAAFVLFWFVFMDSHSLWARIQLHHESSKLMSANQELRTQIEELQRKLDQPLTDAEVERIAREDYGMTRPGEVVYPVEKEK